MCAYSRLYILGSSFVHFACLFLCFYFHFDVLLLLLLLVVANVVRFVLFDNTFRLNYVGSSNINDANSLVKQFNYKRLDWTKRNKRFVWDKGRVEIGSSSAYCFVCVCVCVWYCKRNWNEKILIMNTLASVIISRTWSFTILTVWRFVLLCHMREKVRLFRWFARMILIDSLVCWSCVMRFFLFTKYATTSVTKFHPKTLSLCQKDLLSWFLERTKNQIEMPHRNDIGNSSNRSGCCCWWNVFK